jgi:4-amino-4-deoxy-L-arabinose transferase-like glycosyltransferase
MEVTAAAVSPAAIPPSQDGSGPAWKLPWLTPIRCRLIFAALVLVSFASQWFFLTHDCPIDLSGDEAQYWDWSRHLDLSYYSKGPLIAYLIRGSCALFGHDSMPAVRFPALVLAVGTSLCIYWLTRKLFGSDRIALGAVLLGAIVPMYTAGGTLMTIDPPFFFFWALATCLAVKAVLDRRRWAWIVAGIVVGLGFLTKYSMLLWLPFLLTFLAADSRRSSTGVSPVPSGGDTGQTPVLRTVYPWLTCLIALAFTAPVLIWNARHGWVSIHHVATQTNTGQGNTLPFVGAQIGIANPGIAVFLGAAICYALTRWSKADPHRRGMLYLVCIGLPFFVVCLLDSIRTKVQPNWPAPAYFTLLILTAYFISTRLQSIERWRPWRGWFVAAIAFGLLVQLIIHTSTAMYPLAAWVNRTFPKAHLTPQKFDLVFKLRGIAVPFARTVSDDLKQLPSGSFILCEDYQDASQLAFYVDGQPNTYFAGSYWTDPGFRRRRTQFDMWPDRQLDRPELLGKDVIYVGWPYAPLIDSFERVERLPDVTIARDGLVIRTIQLWRCTGFKGMHRPEGPGSY